MRPHGFVSMKDEAKEIREDLSKPQKLIRFGVSFLDDSLLGIGKEDFIVLAGGSGGGKTELAVHMALTAAKADYRVRFLALEAHRKEITMRIIFKKLSQRFFDDKRNESISEKPAYDKWSVGWQNHLFKDYRDVWDEFENEPENLLISYPESDYTIDDFEKDLIRNKGEVDLYFLDHLHYMTLGDDDSNVAYKNTVKKIKGFIKKYEVPLVLVSHIRKTDRRTPTLCPDQEDVHGSSDIVKISTKAITIAAAGDYIDTTEKFTYPTFMRVAKNRKNGSTMRALGAILYNFKTNTYDEKYVLGRQAQHEGQTCFKPLSGDQMPDWATSHKNNKF
jgi:replicative DNA helicase